MTLKAPFPAFGGKSKVAALVWERLGDVDNAIEPFCFSAAWLLARPHEPRVETLNDLNAFVSNFWRSVRSDPEAVASYADWPVSEVDMHARHKWLMFSEAAQGSIQRVKDDPDYFNAKIAGWWCYGACCWIGSGWCDEKSRNIRAEVRPKLSECVGQKIHSAAAELWQQMPRVADKWLGVHKLTDGRVQLADAFARGRGVHGNDSASSCEQRRQWLTDWMMRLADRLRAVRVCCGHWDRVCGSPSTMTRLGLTGVFLDPPYRKTVDGKKNRAESLYVNDSTQDVDKLCDEVQEWCLKWGDDPQVRIALCGLEGEYDLPGWTVEAWRANGGYGNQSGKVNENAARERIWFSPHCIQPEPDRQFRMFEDDEQ